MNIANSLKNEKAFLSCASYLDQCQGRTISSCLQALIDCTRQAIEIVSLEQTKDLLNILAKRQALIDELNNYGAQIQSLSAADLAQRARLYKLDAEMTVKAKTLQDKQREGLMSVQREKIVSSYGKQPPQIIQAFDRHE